MVKDDPLIAWIHEEMCRIGCEGIEVHGRVDQQEVLLRRGPEIIRIHEGTLQRALFLLTTRAGDEAAWTALKEIARR
jgi:hypothetical protein